MEIRVNEEPFEIEHTCDLAQVLKKWGVRQDERGIAVALNEQVIRRADWQNVNVVANDRIEIIRATQGG